MINHNSLQNVEDIDLNPTRVFATVSSKDERHPAFIALEQIKEKWLAELFLRNYAKALEATDPDAYGDQTGSNAIDAAFYNFIGLADNLVNNKDYPDDHEEIIRPWVGAYQQIIEKS